MKHLHRLLALITVVALFAAACGSDAATVEAPEDTAAPADAVVDNSGENADNSDDEAIAESFDIDAALAADPNCTDPLTGDPLIIGYAADFSDLGGFADGPASAAAEHFINQVNCSGGVNGVPLSLVIRDISGDPETTALAAEELINEGVSAMLGPPFPDFGFPLLQVTNGEIPVLFTGSTEPALSDTAALSYLVAFDDTQQATAAAQYALDQGFTTAVTFSAPGPYFGYNPEIFTEVFTAGGGTLLADYNFVPIEDVDFSTQVNQIAAGEAPDVVYGAMLSFQLTALRGQLDAADLTPMLITTDSFEATGGYFGDNIEGIVHTTHTFPTAANGRTTTLDESFAAATGAPSEAPAFAALAVDAIAVIIDAFERTESTDPATLGAAIADANNVEGVSGTLSYNGTGTPTKTIYVHRVVDGEPSLAGSYGG